MDSGLNQKNLADVHGDEIGDGVGTMESVVGLKLRKGSKSSDEPCDKLDGSKNADMSALPQSSLVPIDLHIGVVSGPW